MAQGEVRGRATLLGELAARKFGAETAERLSEMVDPGNGLTPDVVDAIYASVTASELLARVGGLTRR